MNNMPIERRTIEFVVKIAKICQDAVSDGGGNIIYNHLLDSCVTAGVAVRGYEYAESSDEMTHHLTSAQKELNRTHYLLDMLCETGAFDEAHYDALSTEVAELIRLAEQTTNAIQD